MEAEWREQAACREPRNAAIHAAVYDESAGPYEVRRAKKVCDQCPVEFDCALAALRSGERFGVWGGMSDRERRRFLKQRKLGGGQRRRKASA